MRRIMGLDFGSKTVGVAVSDSLCLTAQGLEIIRRKEENKLRRTYARIEELAQLYDVGLFVVGLPRHMNYDMGERAELTRDFASNLERRTGLPVLLWDERLTTVQADRTMIEGGVRREKRKKIIDQIAAVLILQNYLDYFQAQQDREKSMRQGNEDELEQLSIPFIDEEGNEQEFSILDSTQIAGVRYLLVTDDIPFGDEDDGADGHAYLMKEVREEGADLVYQMVEDEEEYDAVMDVFEQLVDDVDFVKEK